ncbi:uncharacterized protein [Palaemon carinicauda]|uniref:uncharacterized protein isoform X1 n=1 Tax=Palaemon carinicauda TaxID=392227 RepID=UPI0035B60C70
MPFESPYRNPTRWRAVIYQQENRHGTAGCLLSLILLTPLLVKTYGVATVLTGIVIYSCIVVPAVTNYFSFARILLKAAKAICNGGYSCRSALHTGLFTWLGNTLSWLWSGFLEGFVWTAKCLLMLITLPFTLVFGLFLPLIHNFYLAFEGFRVTSNQVVFFMLCERLITPHARLASLYFLLFYTVLAYLKKSLSTRQWSQIGSTNSTSMQDFLRLTTWYIAVRLGKGVAMSFVLVMFTMQFNHIEPDFKYIAITFVYFTLTQRKCTGDERIVGWTRSLGLEVMEQEEEFWVPLVLQILPTVASACAMVPLCQTHLALCSVASYTNIIVPFILLKEQIDYHHLQHTDLLVNFRRATIKEIEAHSTCPVCLEDLRVARATPCGHLYHAVCLRKCLAISPLCPMCKQSIK